MTMSPRQPKSVTPRASKDGQLTYESPLVNVVSAYPDKYIDCRDLGHSWSVNSVATIDTGFARTVSCEHCDTVRTETYDKRAQLVSRGYTYEAGYKVKGFTRRDLPVFRLEALRRSVRTGDKG